MTNIVRTRFAPSPTGFLHVGGVRTALFNYLYAKQNGGQFILRLEDTDRERYVEEGVQQIVDSLDWLGLKPDEGFWISDDQHQNTNFVQSKRHEAGLYQKYVDRLLKKDLAYRDWTTGEQLDKLRDQAKRERRAFLFRKNMASTEGDETQPHVIRLDIVNCESLEGSEIITVHEDGKICKAIEWQEPVRSNLHQKLADIDDFIIMKSDGFPTYNFANVVDDHEMQITHVLRGDEFIASTAKHQLLYQALELTPPQFVHLSVINGTDGKKLSKRTGETNTLDYREKGYLPDALLCFLAQLGWNDGTEQEIFSRDELIEKFSLERINNSPATFDEKRLEWVNGQFIRQLSTHDLYEKVGSYWPKEAEAVDGEYKKSVLALAQDRLKTLKDLQQFGYFFTDPQPKPELIENNKQLNKLSPGRRSELIDQAKIALENSDFTPEAIQETLNQLLETTGEKPGTLFSLIRIYTTWAPFSPQLNDTLALLGRETTLRRLQQI